MHYYNGFLHTLGEILHQILQIGKIRNRFAIIVFQGVGVKAHKEHIPCLEMEVRLSPDGLKNIFSRAQTIMIAQQHHPWHAEAEHDVALNNEFARCSKIGEVASMNHKIHIASKVDVLHHILGFVIPSLRVADEGKSE